MNIPSAAVDEIQLLGTGEAFRSGDPNDLARKIENYLDDGYARESGAAAFAAFRRIDLSEERHVAQLLQIYRSELAARRL